MEEYIEQIEKFLRDQMSQQEEELLKRGVKSNAALCSKAHITAVLIKV